MDAKCYRPLPIQKSLSPWICIRKQGDWIDPGQFTEKRFKSVKQNYNYLQMEFCVYSTCKEFTDKLFGLIKEFSMVD